MSALFYTQHRRQPGGPVAAGRRFRRVARARVRPVGGRQSRPREIDADWMPDTKGVLKDVRKELDQYFAGTLKKFSTKLAFNGTPFQNAGLEGADAHPVRRDDQLSGSRESHQEPEGGEGGRHGERRQPDRDHRALPSRDRLERIAHRIRRRTADQACAARTRKRPAHASLTFQGQETQRHGAFFESSSDCELLVLGTCGNC